MAYKAAIFDLDGTLLNTLDDLHGSVNHTLEEYGFAPRGRQEIRSFLGNGMQRLIHLSLPDEGIDPQLEAQVLADFKKYYAHHSAERTAPYPQITQLLEVLSGEGVLRGVVSNKGDFAVQDLIAEYFPGLFNIAVGEMEGIRRKPAPDTVLKVMDRLGVSAEESVYIGDSEVDIQTAANVGCDCVAVSWGFRDRDQLVADGAKVIADNTEELAEAILLY